MFKKVICAIMLICLVSQLFTAGMISFAEEPNKAFEFPSQIGIDENSGEEYKASYEETARDNLAILYADKTNGWIALQNRKSGKIWYSTPNDSMLDTYTLGSQRINIRSDLVISYVEKKLEAESLSFKEANSHICCVREKTVTVQTIPSGVRVTFNFEEIGIVVPVVYTLVNGCLEVSLDIDNIKVDESVILGEISLLPSFGAGNRETDGRIFVPDGSGALIYFNNNKSVTGGYETTIYGEELADNKEKKTSITQAARMPVFGIMSENEALMGVVTGGAGAAAVTAQSGGDSMGYNIVSSKAVFCSLYRTELYKHDPGNSSLVSKLSRTTNGITEYKVRYYMLSGADASIIGMADTYRNYLIEEKDLKKQPKKPALVLDIQGAADKKASFLGIPYTKIKPLTTYKQAEQIMRTLEEDGADNIAVRYSGWTNSGILNLKIPGSAKPIAQLGGKNAFDNLSRFMDEKGFDFYPDIDLISYRESGNGVSKTSDSIQTVFGQSALQPLYMRSVYAETLGVTPMRLLTPQKISGVAERFLKSYKKLGVKSVSLSGMGSYYYSNLDPNKGFYRSEMESIITDVLEEYSSSGLSIAFDQANAYAVPYADRIFTPPPSSSGYVLFNEDVPFYQIVLHGYVNMTSESLSGGNNPELAFLYSVETGSELMYTAMWEDSSGLTDTRHNHLFSTAFSYWKEDAAVKYNKTRDYLNAVYDQTISEYGRISDNVIKTVFSNGVSIIVNYNDKAVVIDSVSIGALDFVVMGIEG